MTQSKKYKKIIVFIASPSDMATEKGLLTRVIDGLNKGLGDHLGLILESKEWGSVLPGMGRAEDVILNQLPVNEWDIFIGLMWLRFGQPTGGKDIFTGEKYESGTEEEFNLAYRSWLIVKRPKIMFYRCVRTPKTINELDLIQYTKVTEFFKKFDAVDGKNPGLYYQFEAATDFERIVSEHLIKILVDFSEQVNKKIVTEKTIVDLVNVSKNNLPRRVPFFGRNIELEFALNALSPHERGWGLVIDGIGGIGKTALAIEIAYICKEKGIFDEFVFITAKQHVLHASGIHKALLKESTLDGFLNELARRVGRDDLTQIPDIIQKQKNILASLHERKILAIFDNLETLPKVEQHRLTEFLRYLPIGSKAIITSRQSIGESVAQLRLDKLAWDDAYQIIKNQIEIQGLTETLNAKDPRWKELYDFVGGSPLGIIWSMGLIRTLSFDSVLQRLRDGIEGDLSEFLYSEFFKQMDQNEKIAISSLAFFETPATRESLSKTSGLPLLSLDTVLERLRVLSLVNPVKPESNASDLEKYALHPLTKKYALADLMKKDELYLALGMNFAEYWVGYVKVASSSFQESFDHIEREWKNFDSAAEWLWKTASIKEQLVVNKNAALTLIRLSESLQTFFMLNDRIDDLVKFNSWAFTSALILHNRGAAKKLAKNVISTYKKMNLPNHAKAWEEKLFAITGSPRRLRVFISYATEDRPKVRDLYKWLVKNDFEAWLDEEKLLPGQDWNREIKDALRNSDAIIVCLSKMSIRKEGYIQKEINSALDVADEKPEGTIWIIPARLEESNVPDRLKHYQWVDLFSKNGYLNLEKALLTRAKSLGLR